MHIKPIDKVKTLSAGYKLTVTSWENDADNYNTKSVDGLSLLVVTLLVDIIRLFYSTNNPPDGRVCHGNLYDPSQDEIDACYAAIQAVLDSHPAPTELFLKDFLRHPKALLNIYMN